MVDFQYWHVSFRSLWLIAILCLRFVPTALAFDRDGCLALTKEKLENQTLYPTSTFFHRDPVSGVPYNGLENMTVTLQGCYALCGPKQTFYKDVGPRLFTWLLPILLLITNVDLSPLDKRRFLAVIHLLGDPIDSIWSLLHKLDAWDRCDRFVSDRYPKGCVSCRRIVATVLGGYEEILGPNLESRDDLVAKIRQHNLTTKFNAWRRAALRLADSRTDEIWRTLFAILLYIFQLVAAFVPEVGGTPPGPPGGRIATIVLLSWLVYAAILSNMIGNLSSRRIALDIMTEFARGTCGPCDLTPDQFILSLRCGDLKSSAGYFTKQAWNCGIYSYRPWKMRQMTTNGNWFTSTGFLGTLASLPLMIGFIGGVIVLWFQLITSFNCRHIWLILVTSMWLVSALFTMIWHRPECSNPQSKWRRVLIKDGCIAVSSFLIMFLSACGLFNFCWCWSGLAMPTNQRRVPLVSARYYDEARTIYPGVVGGALTMVFMLVVFVAVHWRRGRRLLRWGEKVRHEEWKRLDDNVKCNCMHDLRRTLDHGITAEDVRCQSKTLKPESSSDFLQQDLTCILAEQKRMYEDIITLQDRKRISDEKMEQESSKANRV